MEEEGLIARNVRLRMEAKGLGPKTLSLKAGLNETYVRDLLKGRSRNPRQGHLQNLAVALECRVSDLTGEKDPSPANPVGSEDAKRDLLAAYEAADDQGRAMLLRLAASLRRDAEADNAPPGAPNPGRAVACVLTVKQLGRRQTQ